MNVIDWSKAGKRIRHQDRAADGSNPDWDWAGSRWKDEADYYAEELEKWEVVAMVACPRSTCGSQGIQGRFCFTPHGDRMDAPHRERRRAAGVIVLHQKGPRFGGEIVDG